ncbi:hypothetical protein [Collimonas sp. PA-H2]|uniref:hypothetical protein n=1 Tax=Collimonas sp. PA-H2 TaxID=1881062 RepID=UPI00130419E9|nr:hypothetical protein [Collimonas sp. PA-H2]
MARSTPRDQQGKRKQQSAGCAADGIASGKLCTVLDEYVERTIVFRVPWPSSRH